MKKETMVRSALASTLVFVIALVAFESLRKAPQFETNGADLAALLPLSVPDTGRKVPASFVDMNGCRVDGHASTTNPGSVTIELEEVACWNGMWTSRNKISITVVMSGSIMEFSSLSRPLRDLTIGAFADGHESAGGNRSSRIVTEGANSFTTVEFDPKTAITFYDESL